MINLNHVRDLIPLSPDWNRRMIGKFTSSAAGTLMFPVAPEKKTMMYLYKKVGERITGTRKEIVKEEKEEACEWGHEYENDAIDLFIEKRGNFNIMRQKFVNAENSLFGCTLDGLALLNQSVTNKDEWDAFTLEVKCPFSHSNYMKLFLCDTPDDVKKNDNGYYWQVLDQMVTCNVLKGYLMAYHPEFPPETNHKIIEFRMVKLIDDISIMKKRREWATMAFADLLSKFAPNDMSLSQELARSAL